MTPNAGTAALWISTIVEPPRHLYIDHALINMQGAVMALQIANPGVVAKVDRLARQTGLSKTAIVERAVDLLAAEAANEAKPDRIAALLAQFDRIADREDAFDPLAWDERGLPR